MVATTTDLTGQQPMVRLPATAALGDIAAEVAAYHAQFAPLYRRREQRAWGELYLRGLLLARWVVCDEGYGDSPALLDRWAATGLHYLAELPRSTQGWCLTAPDRQTPQPAPQTWVPPQVASGKGMAPRRTRLRPDSAPKGAAEAWAAQVPPARWQRYRVVEGSKGPLVADFVAVRWVTVRDRLPGPEGWLLVRRSVPTTPEQEPGYKYYASNAPTATPLTTLVWLSGMRWPIEACFAEGRQEVGLDHYETRSWRGRHHHLTLVILAHHFLVRLQQRLDPREGGLPPGPGAPHGNRQPVDPVAAARPAAPQPRPSPRATPRLPAAPRAHRPSGARAHPLPPAPQARRPPHPSLALAR